MPGTGSAKSVGRTRSCPVYAGGSEQFSHRWRHVTAVGLDEFLAGSDQPLGLRPGVFSIAQATDPTVSAGIRVKLLIAPSLRSIDHGCRRTCEQYEAATNEAVVCVVRTQPPRVRSTVQSS